MGTALKPQSTKCPKQRITVTTVWSPVQSGTKFQTLFKSLSNLLSWVSYPQFRQFTLPGGYQAECSIEDKSPNKSFLGLYWLLLKVILLRIDLLSVERVDLPFTVEYQWVAFGLFSFLTSLVMNDLVWFLKSKRREFADRMPFVNHTVGQKRLRFWLYFKDKSVKWSSMGF